MLPLPTACVPLLAKRDTRISGVHGICSYSRRLQRPSRQTTTSDKLRNCEIRCAVLEDGKYKTITTHPRPRWHRITLSKVENFRRQTVPHWRFIRREIRYVIFTSTGRTCQLHFDTTNWQYDRVRASRLTTRPCARNRRKTTFTSRTSADQCVVAHVPDSHNLHVRPNLISFSVWRPGLSK